eukprot:317004-Chlamydomonas_euryale.AAC.6
MTCKGSAGSRQGAATSPPPPDRTAPILHPVTLAYRLCCPAYRPASQQCPAGRQGRTLQHRLQTRESESESELQRADRREPLPTRALQSAALSPAWTDGNNDRGGAQASTGRQALRTPAMMRTLARALGSSTYCPRAVDGAKDRSMVCLWRAMVRHGQRSARNLAPADHADF